MPKSSLKAKRHTDALPSSARDILLLAAKRLFAQKGLSGTSIRDIALAAHMNSSQISYYFDSKEGLYRACIQSIAEERILIAEQILLPPTSREEFRVRLRLFVDNLFAHFLEDRDTGLIIIREFDRMNSPAAKIFKSYFARLYEMLIVFFRVSTEQKFMRSFQSPADPLTLTSLFFGSILNELRFDHLKEDLFSRSLKNSDERKSVSETIVDLFS